MKAFEPRHLDIEALAKAGGQLDGTWALADLPRLASSTVSTADAAPPVSWEARGELRPVRAGAQVWLHVQAHADVQLECQRCLRPVDAHVDAERSFLFVHGEDAAAQLDAGTEDDVLALTRALDLRTLIEDELLLALPLVPRHAACPEPLVAPTEPQVDEAAAPHPFAALAALKRGQLPN